MQVKKLSQYATIPTRGTPGAAGFDLSCATFDATITESILLPLTNDHAGKKRKFVDNEDAREMTPLQDTFVYGSRTSCSHIRDTVTCTANVSEKCKMQTTTEYATIKNCCDNHEGKYVCLFCARTKEIRGKKNEMMKNKEGIEDFEFGKYTDGSHKIVRAHCSSQVSSKCTKEQVGQYGSIVDVCRKCDGKYMCIFCSRATKFMGRNNPNCCYHIDDNFMKGIDCEFKAYLLGWIGSDGCLSNDGSITIAIHEKDILLLTQLKDGVCGALPIHKKINSNLVYFRISSTTIKNDVAAWFGLDFKKGESHKKSAKVLFPKLSSDVLKWHFLRGYFDGDGCIITIKGRNCPKTSIVSNSSSMIRSIAEFVDLPCFVGRDVVQWSTIASMVFMTKLYHKSTIRLHRKHDKWLSVKDWRPHFAKEREKLNITLNSIT